MEKKTYILEKENDELKKELTNFIQKTTEDKEKSISGQKEKRMEIKCLREQLDKLEKDVKERDRSH